MKKIVIWAFFAIMSNTALANVSYKGTDQCEYDYDDINFCSASNIAKYKKALQNTAVNFDGQYILLNVKNKLNQRFVAIDSKTGRVFTSSDDIQGFKNSSGHLTGKPAIVNYSVDNAYLCIQGSVSAYRNAYDNIKVCYSMQDDEYAKFSKSFNRVDVPEDLQD